MDARCNKYWDDGQELLKAATTIGSTSSSVGKMLKECRTMSRFLQKNQSSRFSENAQQKLIETIGFYMGFCHNKNTGTIIEQIDMKTQLMEAIFQVVKDGLAMPFNVFGTKQKKRLMKWYNELIGIVGGGGSTGSIKHLEGLEQEQEETKEWSVLDIDEDGYVTVLDETTGETKAFAFQVQKKSKEFKQIQKALESKEVQIITRGDKIQTIKEVDDY